MTHELSASELSALVLKAARGAGLALGAAEDLAARAPHLTYKDKLAELCTHLVPPFAPPNLENEALKNGHPILAELAAYDLRQAGIGVTPPNLWPALAEALEQPQTVEGPFVVNDTDYRNLETFAAKTYVPETSASRVSGAGAGLTDND